jgi:CheY-like chemotaxis protein
VDLVISDYNLPDTLGTTLAAEIKAKDCHIKIILMSGLNESEIKDSHLVDLILGKPVDPSLLMQAIQKLLI